MNHERRGRDVDRCRPRPRIGPTEQLAKPLHVGRSTVVIEVRIERIRVGGEPKLAANLIVTQFVLPPRES